MEKEKIQKQEIQKQVKELAISLVKLIDKIDKVHDNKEQVNKTG